MSLFCNKQTIHVHTYRQAFTLQPPNPLYVLVSCVIQAWTKFYSPWAAETGALA